jgi:hypothetical protein
LALVGFWFVWANIMTTATSLRFEQPKINLTWLLTCPFGILVGLAYVVWTLVHFNAIYFPLTHQETPLSHVVLSVAS